MRSLAKDIKKFLKHEKLKLDLVLVSVAERAVETAAKISEKLELTKQQVVVLEELYLASSEKIERLLSSYLDRAKTLLVIGHNP